MADTDDKKASAQVWGAAVVVASALAVVAAYLINGAVLVLAVAGVEVLLLMVYVGRRWRALHQSKAPERHRSSAGSPGAAHCERCRRAREALDARQARDRTRADREPDGSPHSRRPQGRAPHEHPWTAERAVTRSVDRTTARGAAPDSAGRVVGHQ
ncbi:hypothetical protein F7Q99_16350 [Streptomyces kaniharaensis]|uniref:Uncharacterized protein n=1 Tax=Streptomyces kaniharaensis TaxID=212423 RepID=A0A6N7KTZ7_9ACTN|nr:hypothetical protein [Streptomyces kaniharaensis]MQS13797.1 hypothetical protein [Streptomyces kaniharaensis]